MLISEAFAQTAENAQAESSLVTLISLFFIFIIFYLLLIRPQAKRAKEHKQTIESLQRGDEIITSGGILGLITNVSESYVIVEIAPGIEVTVFKQAVQTLLPKGTLRSIEPKGGKSTKTKSAKPAPAAAAPDNSKVEDTAESAENREAENEKK